MILPSSRKNMRINKLNIFQLFLLSIGIWLSSCSPKQGTNQDGIKFQQYYIQGEKLFEQHCSNCHQKNGKGLGLVYPPLNQSDFIDGNQEKVICLIRYGISGELVVNGSQFNKEMPAIPSLTDLEIAEIITYLYNTWGRNEGILEVKEASKILENCAE